MLRGLLNPIKSGGGARGVGVHDLEIEAVARNCAAGEGIPIGGIDVGGIFDGAYKSKEEMMEIATIPSREVLLSKIAYL